MDKTIKYVDLPLSYPDIHEYMQNPDKNDLIGKYKDANIKGKNLLIFLSNAKIPVDFDMSEVSKEDKFELLYDYMIVRNLVNINTLTLTMIQVIFEYKGLNLPDFVINPVLNKEEILEFIDMYEETIDKIVQVLDSLLLFTLTCHKDFSDFIPNIEDEFPVVEDLTYIGANFVHLFKVPGFFDYYFSVPIKNELTYFTKQYNEYIYKGENLFHFFNTENNSLLTIYNGLTSGLIKVEDILDLNKALEEA